MKFGGNQMKISISGKEAPFAAHFLFEGEKPKLPAAVKKLAENAIKAKEFTGKEGTQMLFRTESGKRLLLGLGKKDAFVPNIIRVAAGRAAAYAEDSGAKGLSFAHSPEAEKICGGAEGYSCVISEGAILALYKFDKYKSKEKGEPVKKLLEIFIASPKEAEAKKGVAYATAVCGAANFARDIGNESGEGAAPIALAQSACGTLGKEGVKCRIIGEKEANRLGMALFLAVSRGSEKKPAFVVMEHNPRNAKHTICLVGKGVTFDSGGISLKPGKDMDRMRHDKCGAAAVFGAMLAASRLQIPHRVVGIAPLVENMPSGGAVKPGDIVKAANGKTVEILNTDAEGRLILADALLYAQKFKPEAVIDLATLTGAVAVALGPHAAAVIGKNDWIVGMVKDAGGKTHERVWELPLWKEYHDAIRGEFADIKNIGDGDAGTIAAAAFLSNFTGEEAWAHIDIAATAYSYKPRGVCLWPGATGFGVRLLAKLMSDYKPPQKKKDAKK